MLQWPATLSGWTMDRIGAFVYPGKPRSTFRSPKGYNSESLEQLSRSEALEPPHTRPFSVPLELSLLLRNRTVHQWIRAMERSAAGSNRILRNPTDTLATKINPKNLDGNSSGHQLDTLKTLSRSGGEASTSLQYKSGGKSNYKDRRTQQPGFFFTNLIRQHGSLQVSRGVGQEEAVGCYALLVARSLLGVPSVERYPPCLAPFAP